MQQDAGLGDLDILLNGGTLPKTEKRHNPSKQLLEDIENSQTNRTPEKALHTKLEIVCTQCKAESFVILDRRIQMRYASSNNKTAYVNQTEDLPEGLPVEYRAENLVVPYCSECFNKGLKAV